MKNFLQISLLIIFNLSAFGQSDINTINRPDSVVKQRVAGEPIKQYDSFFDAADAVISKKSNSTLGNAMTPTYHGTNTGYGKSKYDKGVNWNADIDQDDVKGSLKRHRDENERKANMDVQNIAFSILFFIAIISIIGILVFNYKPKKEVEYKNIQPNPIPTKHTTNRKSS